MEKIQKICLLLSLLGILLLLILSSYTNPKEISICEIDKTKNNEKISTKGVVSNEKILAENFNLITLEDKNCKAKITCNCKTSILNKEVAVIGRVQIYKNERQISADRIEELRQLN